MWLIPESPAIAGAARGAAVNCEMAAAGEQVGKHRLRRGVLLLKAVHFFFPPRKKKKSIPISENGKI